MLGWVDSVVAVNIEAIPTRGVVAVTVALLLPIDQRVC